MACPALRLAAAKARRPEAVSQGTAGTAREQEQAAPLRAGRSGRSLWFSPAPWGGSLERDPDHHAKEQRPAAPRQSPRAGSGLSAPPDEILFLEASPVLEESAASREGSYGQLLRRSAAASVYHTPPFHCRKEGVCRHPVRYSEAPGPCGPGADSSRLVQSDLRSLPAAWPEAGSGFQEPARSESIGISPRRVARRKACTRLETCSFS